jgi:hypothetical protein
LYGQGHYGVLGFVPWKPYFRGILPLVFKFQQFEERLHVPVDHLQHLLRRVGKEQFVVLVAFAFMEVGIIGKIFLGGEIMLPDRIQADIVQPCCMVAQVVQRIQRYSIFVGVSYMYFRCQKHMLDI